MASEGKVPRYAWLDDELSRESTIVTGSRRLARDLSETHGERQIAAGKTAWRTPRIQYWPDWLSGLAARASEPTQIPRLLDSLSVSVLWERCLGRRVPEDVLSPGGVVRQAVRAWERLVDWNVPVPALLSTATTDDERLFASAAADYSELLQQHNWTDRAGLAGIAISLLASDDGLVPPRLVLAGFDRISPSVRSVLAALQSRGSEVDIRSFADRSTTVEVLSHHDATAELRAAGQWARQRLERNPELKLAIVSPALESDAEDVARLVREGLVPGWQFGGASHRAAANLSYGRRLAEYPGIAVALRLLRWTCGGLSGADVSVLLRSRCLGHSEPAGRSRLERHLRTFPDREWLPGDLVAALAGADDTADALAFLDLARAAAGVAGTEGDEMRAPTEWVRVADDLLARGGWPGADKLDSAGYQLRNRWRELMNEFARVGTVEQSLSWRQAVSRIIGMASETVWQPDSGSGVVAVLGMLEAYGMEFDGLWVCGMDATRWPPPSRPLPCVSRALQRERGMPDSTPADTLAFARRLLTRLAGSAVECRFSWTKTRQDAALTPSTLLDGIPAADPVAFADPLWSARALVATARRQVVAADVAPKVTADERVRGGSYTLQRQYTEPFSAFVHGRLGVQPLDPFTKGLSPGLRGNVIHGALHNLLYEGPSQAEVAGWTDLDERIGSAVDAALNRPGRHADPVLQRLIGLEGRRLRRIIADFVAAERLRKPFRVLDVEKDIQYRHDTLLLGFRIDRVDELADGRLLVIDYKTGMPKSFLNQQGELKDLQLVAYADAIGTTVAGVVFINVDTREVNYRGAGDGWVDGGDPDWDTTLAAWRAELHAVIAEFVAGDTRILRTQSSADARPLAILSRFEERQRDG